MNKTELLIHLASLRERAQNYFSKAASEYRASFPATSNADLWEEMPAWLIKEGEGIANDIADFSLTIGPIFRRSPLLTEADEKEAGHAIKGMRAALRFNSFSYTPAEVLHDEGLVLGFRRPEEHLRNISLDAARKTFDRWANILHGRLELVNPDSGEAPVIIESGPRPTGASIKPGTAFIMMWMSKGNPELDDVSNTVKRCFDAFQIKAVRSDDIEHEDVITNRILDQIKTAEFLFADLTGERPSVYYEVGYAHAIGRRVILFRKEGTNIHFDLAGYNCPSYLNLTDLEKQLMKRLEYVTGTKTKDS